jgi:hypothetical protein
MKKLGVDNYIEKPDCIIFNTICHNEDASNAKMKLYFYKRNNHFFCYTHCGFLSPFRFLEHYYETRNIIYDWYQCLIIALAIEFILIPVIIKKKHK